MSTGKIKKLVSDKGFGFISANEGKEVFFHRSGLVGTTYESLREGQDVEFDTESSPKGPRAINVRLAGQ